MDLGDLPYALETMSLGDIPTVVLLEKQIFPTPWSAEAFRQELTYHPSATYLVLRYTDQAALLERFPRRPWSGPEDPGLLGYGGLWQVVEQSHISTLAVRRSWRGRGLGELIFASLIEHAIAAQSMELTLEVRVSNLTAQNLYTKYGLQVAGRRRRYYPDNHEDAWIMCSPPLQSATYRAAFSDLTGHLHQRLLKLAHDIPNGRSAEMKETQTK